MPIQRFSPYDIGRSYLWKMSGYLQFSFWISIAADMIYLSHIPVLLSLDTTDWRGTARSLISGHRQEAWVSM